MNVDLLREVKRAILEEPKRLCMSIWLTHASLLRNYPSASGHVAVAKHTPPACGTVGCIAGWTTVIAQQKEHPDQLARNLVHSTLRKATVEDYAITALDLSHQSAVKLFFTTDWPLEFQEALAETRPGTRAYARVVARRIEHFIKTDGNDLCQKPNETSD